MRRLELAGQRFSRLVAIERVRVRPGLWHWRCQCDCGQVTTVVGNSLICGNTTSCGCRGRTVLGDNTRTHGKRQMPEYGVWKAMRGRCRTPTDPGYHRYGGRGITVCERWNDFTAFLADMGPRPSSLHSLDRIDNDGPYSPDNCRWTTRDVQLKNTRRNTHLTLHGRTQILSDWCRELGISTKTLCVRLYRFGWSVERALTEPVHAHCRKHAHGASAR